MYFNVTLGPPAALSTFPYIPLDVSCKRQAKDLAWYQAERLNGAKETREYQVRYSEWEGEASTLGRIPETRVGACVWNCRSVVCILRRYIDDMVEKVALH